MSEVTQILNAIREGDAGASKKLLPVVYDELRKIAAQKMMHERPGHSLQPTVLVHKAWLRLADDGDPKQQWDNRGHFFAAAAEAMRRILIENARRKKRQKHGGDLQREALEDIPIASPMPMDDLLDLEEGLKKLAEMDPVKAQLVQLRYFAGLTLKETAEVLNISTTTADRYWAYARAWLHQEMTADS